MRTRNRFLHIAVPIFVIVVVAAAIAAAILIKRNDYYSHPVYSTYRDESGSLLFVMVDGVEYQAGGTLDTSKVGDMIGFLNDTSYPIYTMEGDAERNFLYVKVDGETEGYWAYYRSDFVFPDAAAGAANRISWEEPGTPGTEAINDPEVIEEFLAYIAH